MKRSHLHERLNRVSCLLLYSWDQTRVYNKVAPSFVVCASKAFVFKGLREENTLDFLQRVSVLTKFEFFDDGDLLEEGEDQV